MAAAYLVTLPDRAGHTLFEGVDRMAVYAADATQAKEVAKAYFNGVGAAIWADATVTEVAVAANLIGYTLRVKVAHPTTGVVIYDASVPFAAGPSDTIDEVAALMVTELEAQGGSALTPSYNSGTQVLTIAAAGDMIGNHRVSVEAYRTDSEDQEPIPGFIASGPTHLGMAGAALSVTFAADTYRPPKHYGSFKGV